MFWPPHNPKKKPKADDDDEDEANTTCSDYLFFDTAVPTKEIVETKLAKVNARYQSNV